MKKRTVSYLLAILALATLASAQVALPTNDPIPQSHLITADDFAKELQTATKKPLILNI